MLPLLRTLRVSLDLHFEMSKQPATYFGMNIPSAGTAFSNRLPHFPKSGDETTDKKNAGLRGQAATIIDAMIHDPDLMVPALYGTVQESQKRVAKRNAAGEKLITAATIGQLAPEVRVYRKHF